ncbi:1-acyl-sn-glycerol-3-phosphate acyltransferase [Altererythrobacter xixiisoli]|uniref:1-acyl-sn-glycerol-3-phosphate acyltransferase n=2 Tax=Croceibacterium xixiisoli TaxID=1476466 RepID=A0A6I4TYR4_9SPHN|nr:1-acyl-sn-glycerol-3-phosphate acyltransferase [Croceibacterium xixiisoli]
MMIIRNLLFYIVFYGGSIFYVIAAMLALPFNEEAVRRIAEGWSGFHRFCVCRLLGIKVVIEGHQAQGPVLYAIKHESFFEAIDVPNLLSRPVVFAKLELFSIPGWGRAAKAYGAVAVARDQGATALRTMIGEAKAYVKQGRPLAIFPEGSRMPHGQQPELKSGFAGIYKLLGLPIIPVAVDSGPLYHRRWKRAGVIRFRFGEVIPAGLDRDEVARRVHAGINALNPPE